LLDQLLYVCPEDKFGRRFINSLTFVMEDSRPHGSARYASCIPPLVYLTYMASNSEKQIENLHFLDTKRGRSLLTGFYLIEHSWGEILASAYASKRPLGLNRFVLANTLG
jgi:pimeloyl-ACP methyl ester carboxylesterase